MPVKIELTTEKKITSTPLPNHGGKYAVIPHQVIIKKVKEELSKSWISIKQDFYKATVTGSAAQGIYHLSYNKDPELGLMFAWSNSYDKTQKFKCGIGAYVSVSGNGMIRSDMMDAARKHLGSTAQDDAFSFIEQQIQSAVKHYNQLSYEKELMKKIIITRSTQASVLGRLFADEQILTLTQVGIVKREMDKPSFSYNADVNSLWSMYNHIGIALKESHPTTWLQDHARLHEFFLAEFNLLKPDSSSIKPAPVNEQQNTAYADKKIAESLEKSELPFDKPILSDIDTVVFL